MDRQHYIQTVGPWTAIPAFRPWTDSTTYKQGVQWTVSTAFKQMCCGKSALRSTFGPWTVSTTFKQLGREQTAPPSDKMCGIVSTTFKELGCGQSAALPSNRWPWTVSTTVKQGVRCCQHYIQTAGPRRVSAIFKQAVRWIVSTIFKQVCRGQFFGRDLVILTGIHALSKSSCTWKKVANRTVEKSCPYFP